jgi:hypothetical protein
MMAFRILVARRQASWLPGLGLIGNRNLDIGLSVVGLYSDSIIFVTIRVA